MESGVGMLRNYSGEDKVWSESSSKHPSILRLRTAAGHFFVGANRFEAMTSRRYISRPMTLNLLVLIGFLRTERPRVATSFSKEF